MRNQWRFLLQRTYSRSPMRLSRNPPQFQVQIDPNLIKFGNFSSILHAHVHKNPSSSLSSVNSRHFSSETAVEHKDLDHNVLSEIFSKQRTNDDIRSDLESNGVVVSHELVLKVLRSLNGSPEIALRLFRWVLDNESNRLSSKSFNLMLGVLGANGFVKEFWDLVDVMKKKGFGVCKGAFVRVLAKFEEEGLDRDLEKLREVFEVKNSVENVSSRVCKVIRGETWGDDVEKKLRDLGVEFSSDLVALVLENLGNEPMKALLFFKWVEEDCSFRHDARTYNAMVCVLGREDCIERFWRVVDEMKGFGYEMDMGTYVKVSGRFYKRKLIKEVVDLYEFAMDGVNKQSVQDFTFLLKKIVVSKDLDIDLFTRAIKIYGGSGSVFTDSTVEAVIKSLASVDRLGECNKILKALEEVGFVAGTTLQGKIAFRLSRGGRKDETSKFIDDIEASEHNVNCSTWISLIEGHCVAGDPDRASDCFQKMIERKREPSVGYSFDLLVKTFCRKNRAIDASKLLCDLVTEKELKPKHTTYKLLISKLLVQRGFKEALGLLGVMKSHGFPPFIDPFINYITKNGSGDEAIVFVKEMTVKRFPSTSVFLCVFEAFFKAGRHNEAHDFLSKCPVYIRNHADVLTLFCSMKHEEAAVATAVA